MLNHGAQAEAKVAFPLSGHQPRTSWLTMAAWGMQGGPITLGEGQGQQTL